MIGECFAPLEIVILFDLGWFLALEFIIFVAYVITHWFYPFIVRLTTVWWEEVVTDLRCPNWSCGLRGRSSGSDSGKLSRHIEIL